MKNINAQKTTGAYLTDIIANGAEKIKTYEGFIFSLNDFNQDDDGLTLNFRVTVNFQQLRKVLADEGFDDIGISQRLIPVNYIGLALDCINDTGIYERAMYTAWGVFYDKDGNEIGPNCYENHCEHSDLYFDPFDGALEIEAEYDAI